MPVTRNTSADLGKEAQPTESYLTMDVSKRTNKVFTKRRGNAGIITAKDRFKYKSIYVCRPVGCSTAPY